MADLSDSPSIHAKLHAPPALYVWSGSKAADWANAPAAGRPQTADPAGGQGGFRVEATADEVIE
jgi:hypothetical protein